jgi:O-acetyl-ADP-ribose deacetylase (regulator of RNase III)
MPSLPPDIARRIQIVEGDITRLQVDAIVNAANQTLLGGGGVDGAIHRVAGPDLLEECRRLPEIDPGVRCPTGEARITRGYRLPAKWVIHTVGPVWHGGAHAEDELLAACYTNSLSLAAAHRATSIAFPAISTGVYGYPLERATPIAISQVVRFLAKDERLETVIFCCFGRQAREVYERVLSEAGEAR